MVITHKHSSWSTVKSSLLYFTCIVLLNVSNTVLLSFLPKHFPADFCSWNHVQRPSWGQKKVAVVGSWLLGRWTLEVEVRLFIVYAQTLCRLKWPLHDISYILLPVTSFLCRAVTWRERWTTTTVWITTAVFRGKTFEHFTAKDST